MKFLKFNQEESRQILTKFFIYIEFSFCIIEHLVFMDFIGSIQPLFNIKSCKTIKNDCIALY